MSPELSDSMTEPIGQPAAPPRKEPRSKPPGILDGMAPGDSLSIIRLSTGWQVLLTSGGKVAKVSKGPEKPSIQ